MPHLHTPEVSDVVPGKPEFPALEDLLEQTTAAMSAAESHGHLCGLLCAARNVTQAYWVEQIFGGMDAIEAGCPHCEPHLKRVFSWTVEGMASEDMDFRLFLPDDELPLVERVRAMSAWCQGFLSGVGLGAASITAMPKDAEEVLRDMAELARASEEFGEDEEGEELAYAEIIEYLRTGVMMLSDELRDVQVKPATH